MEEALRLYIGGDCTAEDMQRIEQRLEQDARWRTRLDELFAEETGTPVLLETDEPSLRFTRDVMDAIGNARPAPATAKYVNPAILKGLGILFAVCIVLSITGLLLNINWSAPSVLPALHTKAPDMGALFNSTTFYALTALTLLTALVLADTALRKRSVTRQNTVQ